VSKIPSSSYALPAQPRAANRQLVPERVECRHIIGALVGCSGMLDGFIVGASPKCARAELLRHHGLIAPSHISLDLKATVARVSTIADPHSDAARKYLPERHRSLGSRIKSDAMSEAPTKLAGVAADDRHHRNDAGLIEPGLGLEPSVDKASGQAKHDDENRGDNQPPEFSAQPREVSPDAAPSHHASVRHINAVPLRRERRISISFLNELNDAHHWCRSLVAATGSAGGYASCVCPPAMALSV
jgi:hypothetical protein